MHFILLDDTMQSTERPTGGTTMPFKIRAWVEQVCHYKAIGSYKCQHFTF